MEHPRRRQKHKARLQIELAQARERFWHSPDDDFDLFRTYGRVLRGWWKEVAFVALLCATIAGVISKYYLSRWYTATAIIRPVPQTAIQGQLLGLMSGFAGGGGGAVAGLLGGASGAEANEYIAILSSFAFMRSLVRSHPLLPSLIPESEVSLAEFDGSRNLQWLAYDRLRRRFSCQYSIKTGNLTLHYEDRAPAAAERVEGYFIHDLREQLRHRQIRDTIAAIDSLREEAKRSADPVIESDLYAMIATQIQREKLAEVQADFAFMVIEPPAAPDKHSWPPTMVFCLLAALTGASLVSAYVLFLRQPSEVDASDSDERTAAASLSARDAAERVSR